MISYWAINHSPSNANQLFNLVEMFSMIRNDFQTTSASDISLPPPRPLNPPITAPHLSSFPFTLPRFIFLLLSLLSLIITTALLAFLLHCVSHRLATGDQLRFHWSKHPHLHTPLHPSLLLLWCFFPIYCSSMWLFFFCSCHFIELKEQVVFFSRIKS